MKFGRVIRKLRLQNELSQRELADRLGIDFTYLSKIENSKVPPPSDEVIRKLARELDADLEELLALAAKVSQEDLRETVARDARLGRLFRKLQSGDLTDDQIRKMLALMEAGEENDASGNTQ
ncbi:MAG: helix-turn-helix domain-containing protein [bacterium]